MCLTAEVCRGISRCCWSCWSCWWSRHPSSATQPNGCLSPIQRSRPPPTTTGCASHCCWRVPMAVGCFGCTDCARESSMRSESTRQTASKRKRRRKKRRRRKRRKRHHHGCHVVFYGGWAPLRLNRRERIWVQFYAFVCWCWCWSDPPWSRRQDER